MTYKWYLHNTRSSPMCNKSATVDTHCKTGEPCNTLGRKIQSWYTSRHGHKNLPKQRKHSTAPRKQSYEEHIEDIFQKRAMMELLTFAAPPPRRRLALWHSVCLLVGAEAFRTSGAQFPALSALDKRNKSLQLTHFSRSLRLGWGSLDSGLGVHYRNLSYKGGRGSRG